MDMPQVGDIITYVLTEKENPTDPNKEYIGKVIEVFPVSRQLWVELLDEEYKGMRETIHVEQIRQILGR